MRSGIEAACGVAGRLGVFGNGKEAEDAGEVR